VTLSVAIMAGVAAVAGLLAVFIMTRSGATEQGRYAKRIVGTMLAAFAVILGSFAYALWTWSEAT